MSALRRRPSARSRATSPGCAGCSTAPDAPNSFSVAEDRLRRAVQLRSSSRWSLVNDQARLAAQLRLLELMQVTRYFSGTDRDLLHATQELAAQLGQDDVSRQLRWSEWAALSRGATIAEARTVADRYIERWGDDPSDHVRASAHLIDGVTEWGHGHMDAAIAELDRARDLYRGAPLGDSPLERDQPLIAEAFRLYCYAGTGRDDAGGGARQLRRAPRHAAGESHRRPPPGPVRAGVPGRRRPCPLVRPRPAHRARPRDRSVVAVRLLRRPDAALSEPARGHERRPRRGAGHLRRGNGEISRRGWPHGNGHVPCVARRASRDRRAADRCGETGRRRPDGDDGDGRASERGPRAHRRSGRRPCLGRHAPRPGPLHGGGRDRRAARRPRPRPTGTGGRRRALRSL